MINNELKVMIDPLLFAFKQRIEQHVNLISSLQHYQKSTEPNLCSIIFLHAEYTEDILGTRRIFLPNYQITHIEEPPENVVTTIDLPKEILELGQDFDNFQRVTNEAITLAIQNKCLFYLTELGFQKETVNQIRKKYGLQIVTYEELTKKLEFFLQGFYNYYKFSYPIYGIDSPNIAHQMVDGFIRKNLQPLESLIHINEASPDCKERMRSFTHNRYPDLLVAVDQIQFFKLQQHLDAVRTGRLNNVNPRFHSHIVYHLNFYYYLLYGAIDHLALITNDLLGTMYDTKTSKHAIGFKITKNKERKKFIEKIGSIDPELHKFIVSDEIQEWLFFLGEIRHQSAHREVFTAGPLVSDTNESKLSDEEIDAIIYADEPPVPPEILHMLPEGFEENKKIQDRQLYRISKMEVKLEHTAVVEKDGGQHFFNPVDRIKIDMEELQKLIIHIKEAYHRRVARKLLVKTIEAYRRKKSRK